MDRAVFLSEIGRGKKAKNREKPVIAGRDLETTMYGSCLIAIAGRLEISLDKQDIQPKTKGIGMNRITLLISVLSCSAGAVQAKEWRPSNEFLRAVRFVESSNGAFKVGDNGQSLGDFQLSEAAWMDVNDWRKARRLKTYDYQENVFHAFINRVYASNYLTILHGELSKKLGREPTYSELYAAYNMGLSTFATCDYRLSRVNPVTRAKAQQIETLAAKTEL